MTATEVAIAYADLRSRVFARVENSSLNGPLAVTREIAAALHTEGVVCPPDVWRLLARDLTHLYLLTHPKADA